MLEEAVKWVLTVIGVFLLLRLLVLVVERVANAAARVADGSALDSVLSALSSPSPRAIVVQLAIIAVVVTLFFLNTRGKGAGSPESQ